MYKRIVIFLFLFLYYFSCGYSQKTEILQKAHTLYQDGVELFSLEKYTAAFAAFTEMIELHKNSSERLDVADACYYRGCCAIKLYNNDADALMLDFIHRYPSNSKVNTAYFQVGNFYSANKQYNEARAMYEKTDITKLNSSDAAEFYYKLGYCYFQDSNIAKAKTCFAQVKDRKKSKYAVPATYYYAHILYREASYENALKLFLSLRGDRNFRNIVPYYISQIYYVQRKYDELLAMAPELSASASDKRAVEINRMIATAYGETERFSDALKYWQKCINAPNALPADFYAAGFASYKGGDYTRAAEYFSKVNTRDSLGQNALYHLGGTHLAMQNLAEAKSAFQAAAGQDFDPYITEQSLFNYAKLAVDSKSSTYGESIQAFENYIQTYPHSNNLAEAKEYLAQLYTTSKNYKQAVEILESSESRSPALNTAYQRACLNYGIELFNTNKFPEAIVLFGKAIKTDREPSMTASALYLRADAYYRTKEFDKSQNDLNTFYAYPAAAKSSYYVKANYLMGYNQFMQKKHHVAKDYFSRFLRNSNGQDARIITDAHNRLGDCLYVTRQFGEAIEQYNKAIKKDNIDQDYAMYQKAQCYAALGQYQKKINVLNDLIRLYPNSSHSANAKYQIGEAYMVLNENTKAISYYTDVVKNYPNSAYAKEALAKTGLIYYKIGNDDKALEILDRVVRKYPGTEEAKSALSNIRNIYINRNQADDFFAYTRDIPQGNISLSAKDSIVYQAAENVYLDGRFPEAVKSLQNYIEKYPQGIFLLPAHYNLANSLLETNNKSKALGCFAYVIQQPKSKYTEKSLGHAAEISYGMKKYDEAFQYYQQLSALSESNSNRFQGQLGMMRSALLTQRYSEAVSAAKQVLAAPKLSDIVKEEAQYTLAHAYLHSDSAQLQESEKYYELLKKAKNGDYAGEAYFFFADREFKKNNLTEAEKIIYEISANPRSEYWLAKTFILWGDIFAQRGNILQATQTYQSIVDNYDGEDLKKEAAAKIKALHAEEERKKQDAEALAKQKAAETEVIVLGEGVTTLSDTSAIENLPQEPVTTKE